MSKASARGAGGRLAGCAALIPLLAVCSKSDDDGAGPEKPEEPAFWAPIYLDEELVLAGGETSLALARPGEPAWSWTVEVSGRPSRAVRSGGRFFAAGGDEDAFVSAHEAGSGERAWEGAVPTSPTRVQASDRWVAASWHEGARVFDAQTGAVVVTLERPGRGTRTHLRDDRIVLCGSEGIAVYELPSGDIAWSKDRAGTCTVQGDAVVLRAEERPDRPLRRSLVDGSPHRLDLAPDALAAIVAVARLDGGASPRAATTTHSLVYAAADTQSLTLSLYDDQWTETWSQPVEVSEVAWPRDEAHSGPWPDTLGVHRHLPIAVSDTEDEEDGQTAALGVAGKTIVFDWRTGELLERRRLESRERPLALRGSRLLTLERGENGGLRTLRSRTIPGLDASWSLPLGRDDSRDEPLVYGRAAHAFVAADHPDGSGLLLLNEDGEEAWRLVLEDVRFANAQNDDPTLTYEDPFRTSRILTSRAFAAWAGPDGALNLLDLETAGLRAFE